MLKKVLVLAVVAFFVVGISSAVAGEQNKSGCEGPLQGMYDWCSGLGKACAPKSASSCCKSCGTQCCSSCKSDCGCKCCSMCKSK